jgi:uncharacterized protein (TIGR00255 family)
MSSMTAFSRQQKDEDWGSLTWEIRSVNHRYLETSLRLPEPFRGLEAAIRDLIRKKLSRGKVDCQLRYTPGDVENTDFNLNRDLINKLMTVSDELESIASNASPLSRIEILKWPGVLTSPETDVSTIEIQAFSLLQSALDDLISNREREGAELKGLIEKRLQSIREIVVAVREKMPEILANQKQTLLERLADLKADLEPSRLEQEVALLAQKADVDEELDRLDAHLKEVERVLSMAGQKGRRLDFLMQELNREANTLSSKSIVADTTLNTVELKVLIEQMREQIQNIE